MVERNIKKVARNTLYLYFRTIIVMLISIFTSRIILEALGVEDYGIYNVVGGFVSMFSIISGTLVTASQRFIAFELGKQSSDISRVFSATVSIHVALSIIILFLLETVGLWFLNAEMNISESRLFAANIVFQCSVITFAVNIISIPYNALIIAYERMSAFAYISIYEVLAKLLAVYALYVFVVDSLVLYAVFMLLIAITLRLIYGVYCHRNFKECRFIPAFDKSLYKEMLGFSGWNFIGSSAGILNNQGINMLMNISFGVALNAARGLANQVDSAINMFVSNFMMALNPQITKAYAATDYVYVNRIIISGTKCAFFLFWILCSPVLINTEFILNVWLVNVPDYTALFIRLGIIYTICQNLSQCLYTTMLATGNIKKYQLVVGSLSILAFPFTWISYKTGNGAEYGYYMMILFSLICLGARLKLISQMVPLFRWSVFVRKVLVPVILAASPVVMMWIVKCGVTRDITWGSFLLDSMTCCVLNLIFIWLIGLDKEEKGYITGYVRKRVNKYGK